MPVNILKYAYIFILTLLLSGCATTADSIDETARVKAAAEQWKSYYEAGNYDGLMTLYDANPRVYLHGQPAIIGMQAVRDFFKPSVGKAKSEFKLDYEIIEVTDNTATLVSKYWLTVETDNPKQPYRDAGRSLLIYKKDSNGDWKIAYDIDQASPDVSWPDEELMKKIY